MPRRLTKDERDMFANFTADYPFCWACGIPANPSWVESIHVKLDYPRNLERNHIIRGAGRVHDRRNISMLCKLCHDLSGFAVIRLDRHFLPHVELRHLLWLQLRFEGRIDRPFLRQLRGQTLPKPAPVPKWFRDSFFGWQGVDHKDWSR